MNRFFWSLVNETFEDIFSLKSRLSRTIFDLTLRPGFVSSEYVQGRKARYVPPLRLYLVTSLILVLFLSIQNSLLDPADRIPVKIDTQGDVAALNGDEAVPAQSTSEAKVNEAIEKELVNIQIGFLSEQQVEKLRFKIKEQAIKVYHVLQEEPSKFYSIVLDTLPSLMFILLPLFALLVKVTYLSSGRYYTEHLVFTLHNQCFVYIIILFIQLLQLAEPTSVIGPVIGWVIFLLIIWVPLYLILALKLFYGQGFTITLFKFIFLSLLYAALLTAIFLITMVWGFFTL